MQGKGFGDNVKEMVLAELASGTSVSDLARKYKIAKSTISGWKKELHKLGNEQKLNEFEQLRTEKKQEFIKGAWENIEMGNQLIQRRFKRALEHEDKIDDLLQEIMSLPNIDLSTDQRKALAKKLSAIKVEDVSKITTAIGTLYDKQAVANNENTAKTEHVVTIEDFVKDIQGAKY